jgi:hypothetical protein
MQNGGIVYQIPALGTFGPITGANNGLSQAVTGKIVLGNDAGGSLAALISNREIPMNNFSIAFTQIGQSATAVPIFREDATMVNLGSTPDMLIQDSTSAEQGRIRFNGSVGGDAGDIYMGRLAGSQLTTPDSRMFFGWRTGELTGAGAVALASTAFGYESLRIVTGNNNAAFGSQALHNITSGADNIGIGKNVMLFETIANRNVAIGNSSGPEFGAQAFNDNVWVGHVAGLSGASTSFVATQNVMIGSNVAASGGGGYGNNNILIGYFTWAGNSIGNDNIIIGALSTTSGGVSNSITLGKQIACNISNVAIIGRADQHVIIGSTNSPTDFGARLQVLGGLSLPIRTTVANTSFTLDVDHTIVLNAATLTITIPAAAAGNTGCIVAIVNDNASAASTFSQNYVNFAGASVNTIPANAAIWIQSDGTNWKRII